MSTKRRCYSIRVLQLSIMLFYLYSMAGGESERSLRYECSPGVHECSPTIMSDINFTFYYPEANKSEEYTVTARQTGNGAVYTVCILPTFLSSWKLFYQTTFALYLKHPGEYEIDVSRGSGHEKTILAKINLTVGDLKEDKCKSAHLSLNVNHSNDQCESSCCEGIKCVKINVDKDKTQEYSDKCGQSSYCVGGLRCDPVDNNCTCPDTHPQYIPSKRRCQSENPCYKNCVFHEESFTVHIDNVPRECDIDGAVPIEWEIYRLDSRFRIGDSSKPGHCLSPKLLTRFHPQQYLRRKSTYPVFFPMTGRTIELPAFSMAAPERYKFMLYLDRNVKNMPYIFDIYTLKHKSIKDSKGIRWRSPDPIPQWFSWGANYKIDIAVQDDNFVQFKQSEDYLTFYDYKYEMEIYCFDESRNYISLEISKSEEFANFKYSGELDIPSYWASLKCNFLHLSGKAVHVDTERNEMYSKPKDNNGVSVIPLKSIEDLHCFVRCHKNCWSGPGVFTLYLECKESDKASQINWISTLYDDDCGYVGNILKNITAKTQYMNILLDDINADSRPQHTVMCMRMIVIKMIINSNDIFYFQSELNIYGQQNVTYDGSPILDRNNTNASLPFSIFKLPPIDVSKSCEISDDKDIYKENKCIPSVFSIEKTKRIPIFYTFLEHFDSFPVMKTSNRIELRLQRGKWYDAKTLTLPHPSGPIYNDTFGIVNDVLRIKDKRRLPIPSYIYYTLADVLNDTYQKVIDKSVASKREKRFASHHSENSTCNTWCSCGLEILKYMFNVTDSYTHSIHASLAAERVAFVCLDPKVTTNYTLRVQVNYQIIATLQQIHKLAYDPVEYSDFLENDMTVIESQIRTILASLEHNRLTEEFNLTVTDKPHGPQVCELYNNNLHLTDLLKKSSTRLLNAWPTANVVKRVELTDVSWLQAMWFELDQNDEEITIHLPRNAHIDSIILNTSHIYEMMTTEHYQDFGVNIAVYLSAGNVFGSFRGAEHIEGIAVVEINSRKDGIALGHNITEGRYDTGHGSQYPMKAVFPEPQRDFVYPMLFEVKQSPNGDIEDSTCFLFEFSPPKNKDQRINLKLTPPDGYLLEYKYIITTQKSDVLDLMDETREWTPLGNESDIEVFSSFTVENNHKSRTYRKVVVVVRLSGLSTSHHRAKREDRTVWQNTTTRTSLSRRRRHTSAHHYCPGTPHEGIVETDTGSDYDFEELTSQKALEKKNLDPETIQTRQKEGEIELYSVRCGMLKGMEWVFKYGVGGYQEGRLYCLYKSHTTFFSISIVPVKNGVEFVKVNTHSFIHSWIFVVTMTISIIMFALMMYFFTKDAGHEKCNRTYVLREHYHMDAPDQYLVCIVTSQWPDSGTSSHVSLTLIGANGATQPIHLNVDRFEVGSDMWFVIGSSLVLGQLNGVTLKLHHQSQRTSWKCKKVMVYSRTYDKISTFSTNTWLGAKVPYVLLHKDKPVRRTLLGSYWGRLDSWMRQYHIVWSIVNTYPGLAQGFQQCIRLYFVIMFAMLISWRVLGSPKKTLEGDDKFNYDNVDYPSLCSFVAVLSLFVGFAIQIIMNVLKCLRPSRVHWPRRIRQLSHDLPPLNYDSKISFFTAYSGDYPGFSNVRPTAAALEQLRDTRISMFLAQSNHGSPSVTAFHSSENFEIVDEVSKTSINRESASDIELQRFHSIEEVNDDIELGTFKTNVVDSPARAKQTVESDVSKSSSVSNVVNRYSRGNMKPDSATSNNNAADPRSASRNVSGRNKELIDNNLAWEVISDMEFERYNSQEFVKEKRRQLVKKVIYFWLEPVFLSGVFICACMFAGIMMSASFNHSMAYNESWLTMFAIAMAIELVIETVFITMAALSCTGMDSKPIKIEEEWFEERWDELVKSLKSFIWYYETGYTPRLFCTAYHRMVKGGILLSFLHHRIMLLSCKQQVYTIKFFKRGGIILMIFIITIMAMLMSVTIVEQGYNQSLYIRNIIGIPKGKRSEELQDVKEILRKQIEYDTPHTIEEMWTYVDEFVAKVKTLSNDRFSISGYQNYIRRWSTWKLADYPDTTSRITVMNQIRIRQHRVELKNIQNGCRQRHETLFNRNETCVFLAEKRPFRNTWRKPIDWHEDDEGQENLKGIYDNHLYTYQCALFDKDIATNQEAIPSGGYLVPLKLKKKSKVDDDILIKTSDGPKPLSEIRQTDWLDDMTRAIVLEVTFINTDTNIATSVEVVYRLTSGAFYRESEVKSFLVHGGYEENKFVLVIFVIFTLEVMFTFLYEFTVLRAGFLIYLKRLKSYYELWKLFTCISVIVLAILQQKHPSIVFGERADQDPKLTQTEGKLYFLYDKDNQTGQHPTDYGQWVIDLESISGLYDILVVMVPMVVFGDMMWLLVKARDVPVMDMMFGLVVSTCILALEPILMAVAFCALGKLVFGTQTYAYHTLPLSFLTVIGNTVRGITRSEWVLANKANETMAIIYFVLLFCLNTLIILNFFIVFMNDSYSTLSQEIKAKNRGKDIGFFGYLSSRIKTAWRFKQADVFVQDDLPLNRFGPGGVLVNVDPLLRITST